ncbi:lysylphosphatidylglycerol synthase transmembrane domain-containing protein, partial [Sphaerobacter sp.]|uniref:lysylphosphatidylglycerol synthase transmembrane domain-containing protein n=1 Tax=Sphaerobacter sp. TaxID=2099654 RepID=UPI001DEDE777
MSGEATRAAGGPRPRWRSLLLVWGPFAVAVVALLASGQARAVARAIGDARPGPLLVLLGVGVALPVVHARRWQTMLRAVAADVPLPHAVEMTVTASLVNYAVPGYAGSPVKGVLARQLHDVGFGRSLPTLAAEQVLDAAALALGAVVGLALAGPSALAWIGALDGPSWPAVLAGGAVALGGVGVAVLIARRYAGRFVERVVASGRMLAADRGRWAPVLVLTATYWGMNVAAVWLGARAVGLTLGPVELLLLANLPLLVGLASPLPGGLGLREGAMAGVAGVIGVPVAAIVAAAVLHR